jgi:Rv2258c-like winged HTH domain
MCTVSSSSQEALTARLLQSTIHTLELYGVYLGKELGLYAALTSHGPLTPAELAREAGIARRYAREWLEQQAVAGVLIVEPLSAPPDERRYRLPDEYVSVLVTEDHPSHLAPLAQMVAGIGGALENKNRRPATAAILSPSCSRSTSPRTSPASSSRRS